MTAALCFARCGFDVQVYEQSPEFSEIGAGIQLSPNCTRVLHDLGLESALRKVAFVPEGAQMRDWRSGRVISSSRLGQHVLDTYGLPYYHIHRADLMQVLCQAADSTQNITLHASARVEEFEQDDAGVSLSTGDGSYQGALLIGADGIHSVVRSALFGPEAATFTGCVAWRGLVPAERLPADLVRPMATAWWGPNKHFVHYYVRGGELVNCVCVVEKSGWEVESWSERGDHAELKADFAGWHDTVRVLIENMDPAACYKWALFDRPPMPQWGRGRVSLLGDACHPTLPFMAQGAAMAIEDGAVLSRLVAGGGDVAAQLKRYEISRQARTARIQSGSRRNAKVFHLTGIQAWLRNRVAGVVQDNVLDWLYGYDALAANGG
ncbi:MAG: FAD-dependent monooxygenase, partial [Gammaproteobacteria bacterium]|nr:FAD-dependent monooxygenase [Gammaproteobacteria bacterium]